MYKQTKKGERGKGIEVNIRRDGDKRDAGIRRKRQKRGADIKRERE